MEYNILFSSSSPSPKESIVFALFNQSDKSVKPLFKTAAPNNASFLASYKDCIYAIDENDENAVIYCLKEREIISSSLIPEAFGLCHLSVSEKNKLLFASCYTSGHAAVFDISYPESPQLIFIHDTGAEKGEKPLARTHFFAEEPSGEFAFSVNIELDRIYSYRTSFGRISKNEKFEYLQLPCGTGPRHIVFHPTKPLFYCITEYSNELITIEYARSDGSMKVLDSRSTLNSPCESFGSSVALSRDLKYIYAANRGENSIAVFSLSSTGTPQEKVQSFMLDGDWPRHIALTSDNAFLLVCCQKNDYIDIIELKDSFLSKSVTKISAENPCFVKEV